MERGFWASGARDAPHAPFADGPDQPRDQFEVFLELDQIDIKRPHIKLMADGQNTVAQSIYSNLDQTRRYGFISRVDRCACNARALARADRQPFQ
jgi:hypothetical protein